MENRGAGEPHGEKWEAGGTKGKNWKGRKMCLKGRSNGEGEKNHVGDGRGS